PGPQIINPFLMGKLPYDPLVDLTPVAALIVVPNLLVVHPSVPANSVKELIDYARGNPGKVNFSSAGIGASSHLSGELFKHAANIQITHVPYKGSGAAMQDLLGGNVQMAIDSLPVLLPQIRSNKLRALAVSTRDRSPVVPEIPTIADTLPGFDASAMNYIATRGGTPRPIIERLNRAVNAILAAPEIRERLQSLGGTTLGGTPEQLTAIILAEREKWKKVIEVSGAKAE
ncbi:MAG: tripartite tricarboxylate transporter substrate-binding protein, partial [Burkholderiales bacterium]